MLQLNCSTSRSPHLHKHRLLCGARRSAPLLHHATLYIVFNSSTCRMHNSKKLLSKKTALEATAFQRSCRYSAWRHRQSCRPKALPYPEHPWGKPHMCTGRTPLVPLVRPSSLGSGAQPCQHPQTCTDVFRKNLCPQEHTNTPDTQIQFKIQLMLRKQSKQVGKHSRSYLLQDTATPVPHVALRTCVKSEAAAPRAKEARCSVSRPPCLRDC